MWHTLETFLYPGSPSPPTHTHTAHLLKPGGPCSILKVKDPVPPPFRLCFTVWLIAATQTITAFLPISNKFHSKRPFSVCLLSVQWPFNSCKASTFFSHFTSTALIWRCHNILYLLLTFLSFIIWMFCLVTWMDNQSIYHSCTHILKQPDGVFGISSRTLAHILSCSQGFPHNSKALVEAGERRGD